MIRFFLLILIALSISYQGCRYGMSAQAMILEDNPQLFDQKGKLLQEIGMKGPNNKFLKILPTKIKGNVAESIVVHSPENPKEPLVLELYRGNSQDLENNTKIADIQIGTIEDYQGARQIRIVLGISNQKLMMDAKDVQSGKVLKLIRLQELVK